MTEMYKSSPLEIYLTFVTITKINKNIPLCTIELPFRIRGITMETVRMDL